MNATTRYPTGRRLLAGAIPSLATAMLTACAVGPNFHHPDAPKTDHLTAQASPATTVSTAVPGGEAQNFVAGGKLPTQWWTQFSSEPLNQRVDIALHGSPTVTSAQAALRQAQENYRADFARLLPSFDGSASATREKVSGAQFGSSTPNIFSVFDASVNVSYGVDLFGGTRRVIEQQSAAIDYQRFELLATYQTLVANVVTSSVQEASLRAQIAATKQIIDQQEQQLGVVQKQYDLGGAAYSDVLSARSNLASVRATLPALEQSLDQTRNRLAVYEGKLPSELQASDLDLEQMKLPQDIPLSLPSELVKQRPDILVADAQLHQASAAIGIATAEMLPQITINGSYGTDATHTSDLFRDGIWSIGAGVTQPLLHFGELRAKRRAAVAAYDQAAAQYQQTVLLAFQNVADSLRALDHDAQALQSQYEADAAAQESLQLTQKRYDLGATSYLDLLTAQRQYQQARINYVQSLAARYQDTAALFQALGGSWDGLPATASR